MGGLASHAEVRGSGGTDERVCGVKFPVRRGAGYGSRGLPAGGDGVAALGKGRGRLLAGSGSEHRHKAAAWGGDGQALAAWKALCVRGAVR